MHSNWFTYNRTWLCCTFTEPEEHGSLPVSSPWEADEEFSGVLSKTGIHLYLRRKPQIENHENEGLHFMLSLQYPITLIVKDF